MKLFNKIKAVLSFIFYVNVVVLALGIATAILTATFKVMYILVTTVWNLI